MKHLFNLKRGIIFFWCIWFTLALLSNFFDLLKTLAWIEPSWPFASENLNLINQVIAKYQFAKYAAVILFVCILLFESLITILFWYVFFTFKKQLQQRILIDRVFSFSATLWGVFLIAEEFFIAYQYEQIHFILFLAQFICLMTIYGLPHDQSFFEKAKRG